MSYIPNSSNPIKTVQEIVTDEQGTQTKKDVFVYTHGDGVVLDDGSVASDVLDKLNKNKVDKSTSINGKTLSSNITLEAADVGAADSDHTHTPEEAGADPAGSAAAVQDNVDLLSETVTEMKNSTNRMPLYLSETSSNPSFLPAENGVYEIMNDGYIAFSDSNPLRFDKGGMVVKKGSIVMFYDTDITKCRYTSATGYLKSADYFVLESVFWIEIDDLYAKLEKVVPITDKGIPNGVASLDENGMVPSAQLPAYVDDVIEGYFNSSDSLFYKDAAFTSIITAESGKIYVDMPSNKTYRWSGSQYVEVSASLALGETASTAYAGDKGKALADKVAKLHNSAYTGDAATVNGHTVEADVPADAVLSEVREWLDLSSATSLDISTLSQGWYEVNTAGYMQSPADSSTAGRRYLHQGTLISVGEKSGNKVITVFGSQQGSFVYYLTDGSWTENEITNQHNFYDMLFNYVGPCGILSADISKAADIPIGRNYCIQTGQQISFGALSHTLEPGDVIIKYCDNHTFYHLFSGRGCYSYMTSGDETYTGGKILNESDIIAPVDNLLSTSAVAPLSANQGRILDDKITDLKNSVIIGSDTLKINEATILHGTMQVSCSSGYTIASLDYSKCNFLSKPNVMLTVQHDSNTTINAQIRTLTESGCTFHVTQSSTLNVTIHFLVIGNHAALG